MMLMSFAFQLSEYENQAALNAVSISKTSLTALDPVHASTAETLAITQLPALATQVANLAIARPMRFGWLIQDLCNFIDLGSLSTTTALTCGADLPTAIKSAMCGGGQGMNLVGAMGGDGDGNAPEMDGVEGGENGGGMGPGGQGGCGTLPSYDATKAAQMPKKGILAEIARRVAEIKARDAFRTDATFKAAKRSLIANSSCLPDAALSRQPIVAADGSMTFEVRINGPVNRKMKGDVNLDVVFKDADEEAEDDDAETDASGVKYMVESSRLQVEDGGMGGSSCYHGETQRLKNIAFNEDGTFSGSFSQGFVDTCREANKQDSGQSSGGSESSSSSGGGNAWYQSFVATPDLESGVE